MSTGIRSMGVAKGMDRNRYVRASTSSSLVAELVLKRILTGVPQAHSASGCSSWVHILMYPSSRTKTRAMQHHWARRADRVKKGSNWKEKGGSSGESL